MLEQVLYHSKGEEKVMFFLSPGEICGEEEYFVSGGMPVIIKACCPSKVSLIAAQISSVLTVTMSGSTIGPELSDLRRRTISNGKAPICATAVPSANKPTCGKITRSLASSAAFKHADSSYSTPMTFTCGATSPK